MVKHTIYLRMGWVTALILVSVVRAPQASARLFNNYSNDRLSLIAEAAWATSQSAVDESQETIWIPEASDGAQWLGDWQYPASDMRAYLVLAESGLGKGNYITNFASLSNMSAEQIRAFVAQREPGWGGQCLSFVSLLFLRSGSVADNQLLLSYTQLKAAAKDLSAVQPGDILFNDEIHAAVVLQVNPNGLVVGDSNYVTGKGNERIGMHFMPSGKLTGYKAADLDGLLSHLKGGPPPPPPPPPPCPPATNGNQIHCVDFTGIVLKGFSGQQANVRSGPGTGYARIGSMGAGTGVNFTGWVEGESVPDAWTGRPDNRWFVFPFGGGLGYIASGVVYGNPP